MRKLIFGILVILTFAGCGMEIPVETTLAATETALETTLPVAETTLATIDLCVSCKTQPSSGYGPSGMECADCYYGSDAILEGTYFAQFENVSITLTHHDYVDYILTYRDLTSGITLENIPLAYYNANTSTEISMMFVIDDSYPEHGGYVEVYWSDGSLSPYSYNALIEGLEDTDGDYSFLNKA